ncbi:DUF1704 domain-containing protein [Candidatus Woesearchaeota archaeon]|nr:DUF1704 domain-containing protein [Candidatus Woesearchaeota archaeon]
MSLSEEAKRYDKVLLEVESSLSELFTKLSPLNVSEEKKRFFSGEAKNPVFSYEPANAWVLVNDKLESLKQIKLPEGDIYSALLVEKREQLSATALLLDSIGKDEFTFFSERLYGKPDKGLMEKALKILHENSVKGEKTCDVKTLGSPDIMKAMQEALAKSGLPYWKVEESDITALAAVYSATKKVYVRKRAAVSPGVLKGLVVHEIGTHVFRAANGEAQDYKLFITGFPGYLLTEEGVAANVEEMHGCLCEERMKVFAGRVVAVGNSYKSFREVFEILKKFFSDEEAWNLTLRAKRGLRDTFLPGGYTKDLVYLKGYYDVKEYLEKNGKDALRKLFYGKVGLEHVGVLEKLEGLKEPKHLPDGEGLKESIKGI